MRHLYIICFDITDPKRLRRVANHMEDHGQRIQYSVFECYLTDKQLNHLQQQLKATINPREDHIRYYQLCPKCHKKIQHSGSACLTPDHDYHLY